MNNLIKQNEELKNLFTSKFINKSDDKVDKNDKLIDKPVDYLKLLNKIQIENEKESKKKNIKNK